MASAGSLTCGGAVIHSLCTARWKPPLLLIRPGIGFFSTQRRNGNKQGEWFKKAVSTMKMLKGEDNVRLSRSEREATIQLGGTRDLFREPHKYLSGSHGRK